MTIELLKDLHTTYKMYTYKRINLSVVSIKLIIYRHFSQTTTRGNTHFTTPSQIPYSRSDCTVFGPQWNTYAHAGDVLAQCTGFSVVFTAYGPSKTQNFNFSIPTNRLKNQLTLSHSQSTNTRNQSINSQTK